MLPNGMIPTDKVVRGNAKPGDLVIYSDCANPWKGYEVIEKTSPSEYLLISETGDLEWSDLRQHGWKFARENDDNNG